MKAIPVCQVMCATCPFREGSEYAYLKEYLAEEAMTSASRICHSTGSSAIKSRSGKPRRICRGTRDIQLRLVYALGVIAEPTDQAWAEAVDQLNNKKHETIQSNTPKTANRGTGNPSKKARKRV